MQNRTPYTYLIKHIPSGKVYYGLRHAKGCHPSDLWVTYFTSSKEVKKLIDRDGNHSFEAEVRRIFTTSESAIQWEIKVLRRIQAHRNENFLNLSIPGSTPQFAHSETTKEKLRKPKPLGFGEALKGNTHGCGNRGKKKTSQHCKNISKARKGKNNGHVGSKHYAYGKPKPAEFVEKTAQQLRNFRWLNNEEFAVFVSSSDVDEWIAMGYSLGRGSTTLKKPKIDND